MKSISSKPQYHDNSNFTAKSEMKPAVERFEAKFQREGSNECWPWKSGLTSRGYGSFSRGGRNTTVLAHIFSYETFIGPIPIGMRVCHSCDNPVCVNPGHFFLGTQGDNNADCRLKGRSNDSHGENHYFAKLSRTIWGIVKRIAWRSA